MGFSTLTWNYDSAAGDGFRIYRSDTPMDPEALPTPLDEVAITEREYVDTTVVAAATYYYRVSVYAGTTENVSEELEHVAEDSGDPLWSSVLSLLTFEDGAAVDAKGHTWTKSGTGTIGASSFVANSGYVQSSAAALTSLGSGAVTVEMFLSSQAAQNALFSFVEAKSSAGRVVGLRLNPSGAIFNLYVEGETSGGSATRPGNVPYDIGADIKHHLAMTVDAPVSGSRQINVWLNGVNVFSGSLSRSSISCNNVTFGYAYWSGDWSFRGELFSARITSGLRYTGDFTPPVEPFPNFGS